MTETTTEFADLAHHRASIWRCSQRPATATGTAAYEALESVLKRRALKRDGRAAVVEAGPSVVETAAHQVFAAIHDLLAQAQVPKWLFSTAIVGSLGAGVCLALGSWLLQAGAPCAVHPVVGRVAMGKLVPAGAQLAFHPVAGALPDQAVPRATVQEDGSFTVSTFRSDDGAPVGDYVVTVQWFRLSKDGAPGPNVVPRRYAAPESSPLKVAIRPGCNQLPPITLCR